ncbi:RDD family protein [Alteribacter populi]|uniref:RDD family protein n=1 Tax=Alteribacter populi TaxID=2011011 RepID=UPI000BBA6818|nr:RDD family protein [Alteribacter populi]
MEVNNPAGFWIRFFAGLIDGIILGIGVLILGAVLGFGGDGIASDVLSTIINWSYLVIVPVLWYGYTIGKKAVGVRVVKNDSSDVTWGTMILREVVGGLLYGISFGILAIVSAFMVGLRKDKRAIHDLIAGTYVTYHKPE